MFIYLTFHCPICDKDFKITGLDPTAQYSTVNFTDGERRLMTGVPIERLRVYQCTSCGYVGYDDAFGSLDPTEKFFVKHLLDTYREQQPLVGHTRSDRCELAAKIAHLTGKHSVRIGSLWALAAWECIAEQDFEAERYYRLRYIETMKAGLDNFGEISDNDSVVIRVIVGEMLRRVNKIEEANEWFSEVVKIPGDNIIPANRWLRALAHIQMTKPCDIMPSLNILQTVSLPT